MIGRKSLIILLPLFLSVYAHSNSRTCPHCRDVVIASIVGLGVTIAFTTALFAYCANRTLNKFRLVCQKYEELFEQADKRN